MENHKDPEFINGNLDKFIEDNGKMVLSMDKVNLLEMIVHILDNGKIINLMGMEFLNLKDQINIKDNGYKEIKTEMANKYLFQEMFIMDNI